MNLDEMPDEHPLFPAKEGEEPPEVHSIYVTRRDPRTDRTIWFPRPFMADQLVSLQQLAELFGGGEYELIARGPDDAGHPNAVYVGRQKYHLAGPSKPLEDEPTGTRPNGPPAPGSPVAPPDAGPGSNAMVQLMLGLVAMVQNQSAQNTQLLLGILNAGREDSRAFVQSMSQQAQAHTQQMAELMRAIAETRGGSAGGVKEALEAIELGVNLRNGVTEGAGEGKDDSTFEQVMKGAAAFVDVAQALKQPTPQVPGAPSVPRVEDAA